MRPSKVTAAARQQLIADVVARRLAIPSDKQLARTLGISCTWLRKLMVIIRAELRNRSRVSICSVSTRPTTEENPKEGPST